MPLQPRALVKALSRIEELSALDGPAQAVSSLVSKALPPGPAKDAASGSWLGHPLHPLLVALPIGSWTSATILDLTSGKSSSKAARRLVGLGVLTALPTAATGVSDWSDTMGAERRVGLVHAAGAWTSIALYAASWKRRKPGRHGGALLALAGSGALALTGYLGGHLSYVYGVGVDTNAFQAGPAEWTPVAAEADVAEESLTQVRVDGVPILIARRGGSWYALADRCSHRGGPLSDGEFDSGADGDCVVCPWHGSCFRLADGAVARGPASVENPVYDLKVEEGQVFVRRSEQRSLRSNPA